MLNKKILAARAEETKVLTLADVRTILDRSLALKEGNPGYALFASVSPDGRYQLVERVDNPLLIGLMDVEAQDPFVTFSLPEECEEHPFISENGQIIVFIVKRVKSASIQQAIPEKIRHPIPEHSAGHSAEYPASFRWISGTGAEWCGMAAG